MKEKESWNLGCTFVGSKLLLCAYVFLVPNVRVQELVFDTSEMCAQMLECSKLLQNLKN